RAAHRPPDLRHVAGDDGRRGGRGADRDLAMQAEPEAAPKAQGPRPRVATSCGLRPRGDRGPDLRPTDPRGSPRRLRAPGPGRAAMGTGGGPPVARLRARG